MPTVEFALGNRKFEIACDEGEQENIKKLASKIDVRVQALSKSFSNASGSLILAITTLMMEEEIQNLKQGIAPSEPKNDNNQEAIDLAVAQAIDPVTKYIEKLANKLEKG